MHIHEVVSEEDRRAFLDFPDQIYAGDPHWIRPLDQDIEAVFDPAKNKAFRHGEASRWLLKDDSGNLLGRIATFVNRRYAQQQPTGGIGFFDCLNDPAAAHFMFDHCRNWLADRGMEAMDGPINFGERDQWWGLQVEGFQPPLYGMHYHMAYYERLFKSYGFEVYYEQLCFARTVADPLPTKLYHRHRELSEEGGFEARHLQKAQLSRFVKDFTEVYNKAWASHGEGKRLELGTVEKLFASMKPVMDEKIIWFTYYKDRPIAFWVNLPDLNQYFRYFKGKFGTWQKLRFLWMKARNQCRKFTGIAFGIVPEFQGKGVDAFMIVEASRVIRALNRYDQMEMQWIGDFNPKMINIAQSLQTRQARKLQTLRYLFDRSKPFVRHPMLSGSRVSSKDS